MREIKFRGKKVENGEWVYGDLIHEPWGTFIQYREGEPQEFGSYSLPRHKTKVDPKTVGQFTGLYDSTKWEELTESEREAWVVDGNMPSEWKGKPIYEGDIVQSQDGAIGEIIWDNNYATWRNVYRKGPSVLCLNLLFPLWQSFYAKNSTEHKPTIEVVGNIYENPALLEVK